MKKGIIFITILLHLNNICLREIYITLLEKLLYWVHVYRHFYFYMLWLGTAGSVAKVAAPVD